VEAVREVEAERDENDENDEEGLQSRVS